MRSFAIAFVAFALLFGLEFFTEWRRAGSPGVGDMSWVGVNNAKLVDIGSAFLIDDPPEHPTCTPGYAAPEVLEGQDGSARSDLASLGYVLVEILSGGPAN